MRKVNMHEAKTNLSRLVDGVVSEGQSFVIAKAGKPLVKVVRVDALVDQRVQRLGFMRGEIDLPGDFDWFLNQAFAPYQRSDS